jgi:hypothetical protein
MITRQEYSNLVSGKNQRAEHYRGSVNALCTPIPEGVNSPRDQFSFSKKKNSIVATLRTKYAWELTFEISFAFTAPGARRAQSGISMPLSQPPRPL